MSGRAPGSGSGEADRRTGLGRLWGFTVLAATVLGVLSALLLKWGRGALGSPISWPQAFAGTADWYVWALLVPLVVYLARRFPFGHDRWVEGLAVHVPLGIGVALVELGLFTGINYWYNLLVLDSPYPDFGYAYLLTISRWLPVAFLIYALIVALVTAVDRSRRAREKEVAAARLETELVRAQVHALQAQIQPHFLFNALNTAVSLVREAKRDAAVEVMAALGRLLRRTIELSRETETVFERELDFVRDYLELERHRMEDRLEVRYDIDPDTLEVPVPTMLMQPMVENAVRHGIAPLPEGGTVTLTAHRDGGHLEVVVSDSGRGFAGSRDEGVGLRNARERIRAHYGDAGTLRIDSIPGRGTRARVRIPCRQATAPT